MRNIISILILLVMLSPGLGGKAAYGQTSETPESPVGDCPPNPTWRYDCINKSLPCSTKCGTSIATINARVGIGTTNPQATFEIYSRGSGSFLGGFPALMRMHAPDDSPYLFIFSNDKAGSAGDYGTWLDNSGNLHFSNAPSGTFTDRMILDKAGNIGMGAAPLSSRLLVKSSGNSNATSSLDVQNSSGTSMLFVRDDGNIGVGKNSPNFKLDVNGNINASGYSSNGISVGMWLANGSDIYYNSGNLAIGTSSAPSSRLLIKGSGNTNSSSSLDVQDNAGNSMLFVRDDGNIGVGNNSPAFKLDINGSLQASGTVKFSSLAAGKMVTTDASGNLSTSDVPLSSPWLTNGSDMVYYNYGDGSDDNFGKIGIGTNSPQKAIHIYSKHTGPGGMEPPESNASHGGIRFEVDDDNLLIGSTLKGIWDIKPHSNHLAFSLNDAEIMKLTGSSVFFNQNVGIGTSSPSDKLTVQGGFINVRDAGTNMDLRLKLNSKAALTYFNTRNGGNGNTLYINRNWSSNSGYFSDFSNVAIFGNVAIGKDNPAYQLDVEGTIRSCTTIVEKFGGCDYVFEPNHKRMTWEERKAFYRKYKHLPKVPSVEETNKKGMNIAEMTEGILFNVEEMALEQIDMQEEQESIKEELQELKKQLKKLETDLSVAREENQELKKQLKK